MQSRSPEAILSRSMQRARYSSDPVREAMRGIHAVAKIERGDVVWHGQTERALSSGQLWKAQWRFRSTDPWSFVVNRNQLHIEYTTEDAAIRAAVHTRNEALKFNS